MTKRLKRVNLPACPAYHVCKATTCKKAGRSTSLPACRSTSLPACRSTSLPVDQPAGLPVDQVPVDQVPVDQVPVDQVPVDQVPVDQVPVDQPACLPACLPAWRMLQCSMGVGGPGAGRVGHGTLHEQFFLKMQTRKLKAYKLQHRQNCHIGKRKTVVL